MNSERYCHTATLLPNGKVLVAGNYDGNTSLSSAEIYDPATGTWSITGSMNSARDSHTATLLANGKVLVAGGMIGDNIELSSAELYDPATGTWSTTGSMGSVRHFHTATLLTNGMVLVVGGESFESTDGPSAELYDPSTGIWTSTGAMSSESWDHMAILLADGRVFVLGGGGIDSPEIFDMANGVWTRASLMKSIRSVSTATLLTDGKVLVTGSAGNIGDISISEVYNPSTRNWTSTGPTSNEIWNSTATLLANGKVLVAGGGVDGSRSQVYDPGFATTFTITLGASVQGAITGNTSPYASGSTATLSAMPNPGYVFTGWTGDASGINNPISVLMQSNKTIGATFARDLSDVDADGLPAYDELVIHGTSPTLPDTDGDGFLDGYEVLAHKSPLDPLSRPALVAEARMGIGFEFTFPAALGKTYRIMDSLDLVTWTPLEDGIVGTGGEIQRFYPTQDRPKRFFRVAEVSP
jgi:uncharacterized repeat protein (TIGR02543 family)